MNHYLYLELLLVWVLVLALQWLIGWKKLWRQRRRWPWVVLGASIYFSLADALALGQHIWFFRPAFLIGWSVGNVPVEELLFFVLTTAMVVQGFVLIFPSKIDVRDWQPVQETEKADEDNVKERQRANSRGRPFARPPRPWVKSTGERGAR